MCERFFFHSFEILDKRKDPTVRGLHEDEDTEGSSRQQISSQTMYNKHCLHQPILVYGWWKYFHFRQATDWPKTIILSPKNLRSTRDLFPKL